MTEAVFAIPGDLAAPTGGYAYDRQVLASLPALGVVARHLELPGSFPDPTGPDLDETARRLASVPPGAVLMIDGLAYGAMPRRLIAGIARPIIALVHHPLACETGLSAARRAQLRESEGEALACAAAIIVTSGATARSLVAMFGLDPAVIAVAKPGVAPAPRSRGSGPVPSILAVGAVSPRKGYGDLVHALARLHAVPWRATIAGSLDRAPAEAARIRRLIAAHDLIDRIALAGAVDDAALAGLYDAADLFVLASHFEGYGMALAEAMMRGLAIVATRAGAAAETVPDDAAVKVAPGDPDALAGAMAALLGDGAKRNALADAAWRAGRALPRWRDTAAQVAAVLHAVSRP